jgi:diguanylate cyclase (GGDEF)-like protein
VKRKILTSLQTKLILILFLVGVIPMGLGTLYAYGVANKANMEDQLDLSQKQLDYISFEILETFKNAKNNILISAENFVFERYFTDPINKDRWVSETGQALLYFASLNPETIGDVCLVDKKGSKICRNLQNQTTPTQDLSSNKIFKPFSKPGFDLKKGEVYQGTPYFSDEIQEWVVPTVTPIILSNGEKVGITYFEIKINYFKDLLNRGIRPQTMAFISDSKGRILSQTQHNQTQDFFLKGEKIAFDNYFQNVLQEMTLGGDGIRKTEINGKEYHIIFQPVPLPSYNQNQWSVGFIFPTTSVDFSSGGVKYIFFFLTTTFGVMGIAFLFGRRITHPIQTLTQATRAITSGNLNQQVEVKGSDEVGILGQAFKTMTESLSQAGEQERRRVRQLAILNEIGVALSSENSQLEDLISIILETSQKLIKSKNGGIILINPTTKRTEKMLFSSEFLGNIDPETATRHPLLSRLLLEGTSVRITKNEARFYESPLSTKFPVSLLGVPCIHKGKTLGAIIIADREEEGPYRQEEEDLLLSLAFQVSMVIERNRLFEKAKHLSVTDSLTGLFNHRQFHYLLEKEIERSERYKHQVSIIFMDIDFFKGINDIYGHQAGDSFLKILGIIIKEMIRAVDIPARYGGEEFGIILPETSGKGAFQLAESIRERINEYEFLTPNNQMVKISVSIGVATYPENASQKDTLLGAADRALYSAKALGRNNVQRYQEALEYEVNKHIDHLKNVFENPTLKTIGNLAALVDQKSIHYSHHSKEVTKYALLMAEALNLNSEMRECLRIASLLHDLGLVGVPDYILNKPGPLDPEEKAIIHKHPKAIQALFTPNPQLMEAIPIIVAHHERFNGTGYPSGLKGPEIPLLSRILSIAEAYQAMTSFRPYRRSMTHDEAIQEIKRHKGTQFDPEIVDTFISVISKEKSNIKDKHLQSGAELNRDIKK